jgi:hypothetical protein
VPEHGQLGRGKTLGGEQQPQHENGRTWPKCTAHRALARAVAEWYLIDRCTIGGGVIRSGTWPARWCRSARHQPFRHRRKLGTLQPQPKTSRRWRDTSGRAPLHRRGRARGACQRDRRAKWPRTLQFLHCDISAQETRLGCNGCGPHWALFEKSHCTELNPMRQNHACSRNR